MSLKYALAIAILLLRVADVVAGQDEQQWIVFGHDSASDLAWAGPCRLCNTDAESDSRLPSA